MTTNYCYENKEIVEESHSNECHLSIKNMKSICDLRHLHEQYTNTLGFNMSFEDKAEQRTYRILCIAARLVTDGHQNNYFKRQSGSSVSRALCYRWHRLFSEVFSATLSSNMAGRHTIIKESLTLIVLNSLQHGPRQTEGYCTAKKHRSSICTYDIYRT